MEKHHPVRILLDTCALIQMAEELPSIPRPLTIPAVYEELKLHSVMDLSNFAGDELKLKRLSRDGAKRALRFYDSHQEYITDERKDLTLPVLTQLTGKQIAFDLGHGIIFQEHQVAGDELTEFGKKVGETLVRRVNQLSIPIDEFRAQQIVRIAQDGQKYVFNCVRKYHGRIPRPEFKTDLLILGTARCSPVYAGSEVWVVSNDCDLRQISVFSKPFRDRYVRCMPHLKFESEKSRLLS